MKCRKIDLLGAFFRFLGMSCLGFAFDGKDYHRCELSRSHEGPHCCSCRQWVSR